MVVMKNIYNKTIILSLGILAILAFGMTIIPTEANARYIREDVYGGIKNAPNYINYQPEYYTTPTYNYNPAPVYYPVVQTPTYVNPAPVYIRLK